MNEECTFTCDKALKNAFCGVHVGKKFWQFKPPQIWQFLKYVTSQVLLDQKLYYYNLTL